MKFITDSKISATRVTMSRRSRYNPLPSLSPGYLTNCHNDFRNGRLGPAALLWEEMAETDDILKSVFPKRCKSVSRHGYEVIPVDDSARAKKHAKTLEDFYANITATNAYDANERGGVPLLIRQMQKAVGYKYNVHEILWSRKAPIRAEFRAAPLWYFENTTGRLRFLETDNDWTGVDLEPGAWMITTGDGVMMACAAAYMFKHFGLQDWLIFSEKYGFPVPYGKSEGSPGDAEWTSMENAVADLSGGDSVVVSAGSDLDFLDFKTGGTLPYPDLIKRMDQAMTILMRGADLGTISSENATGASLQADESDILEEDDASNITDVLQEQVDRMVIKLAHGDAEPLAWVQIKTAQRQDVKLDLETDKALNEIGYEDDVEEIQERYSRPMLKRKAPPVEGVTSPDDPAAPADKAEEEEIIENRKAPPADPEFDGDEAESYIDAASRLYSQARAQDMRPLAERIATILEDVPDDKLESELVQLQKDFPEIADQVFAAHKMQDALSDAQAGNYVNGVIDATGGQS